MRKPTSVEVPRRTISLEVAKFLGVPFGWRSHSPHRFEHTESGLKLAYYDGLNWHRYLEYSWVEIFFETLGNPLAIENEEDLKTWAQFGKTRKELEDERNLASR